ncbi:ATP-binding protein [Actinomycetota bacterium Odt1-20B]
MSAPSGLSRGNLPAETTSFVGRGPELTVVDGALRDARVVTVTGPGGVGKTRLALRAAAAARERWPDGVWLADLSALHSPELLALTLSESLRIVDQTVRPMAVVLAEWLADKELLLVLDTCEHLVEACTSLVTELAAVAPKVTLLCTSRQPLPVRGAQVLELRPLTVPDGGDRDAGKDGDPHGARDGDRDGGGGKPMDTDGPCEALELFTERAAAAVPGLRFAGADMAAAEEVCRRLDGIPLALELAAARLRQLSVTRLAAELRLRFETLDQQYGEDTAGAEGGEDVAGTDAGLDRHRTLRTAIGWSHELCTPLERLLWARLAVFPGSFDPAFVREVCAGGPLGADQVGPVLAGLVDKSVVTRVGDRYRMLDTIREYGGQWLAGLGEEPGVRRRHAEAFLRLAREADAEWIGPRQRQWYGRLAVEHANLRAALDFHLARGDAAAAVGMAGALWCFWFCCGVQREGCDYLDRALALDPSPGFLRGETGPVRDRVRAVWVRGYLANVQGDSTFPEEAARQCAAMARPGDRTGAALAAAQLTAARLTLYGDQRATVAALEGWSAEPPEDYAFPFWVMGRLTLGYALAQLGEFDTVSELMSRVRQQCGARGDLWASSIAQYLCAIAEAGNGRFGQAQAHAERALAGPQVLGDTLMSAVILDVLAPATLALGRAERAACFQGVADSLWQRVGGSPHSKSPHFQQARQACEEGARQALGDPAYERAFRDGAALGMSRGLAYARGAELPSPEG